MTCALVKIRISTGAVSLPEDLLAANCQATDVQLINMKLK